ELVLRLYVSGKGGTDKSYLIKTIKCWLKQILKKDTAVAAPTGIAAFNIDGLTVHRLLQLPVEHGHSPKYKQLANHVLKVLRADLKDVSLIIIDEVSMISNLIFMYIHLRLSEIYDTIDCDDGWFGQKHILLFGDLLQLPPLHEDSAFIQLTAENIRKYLGSLSATNLWTLFDYDELTINMRQQEDGSYQNGKLVKIPHKFSLRAVPTTKILIAGQTYKVMNAIFHYGSCVEEGHYTSMCREGISWIEIDDV
ncbi:ATP-dependent DNA helicase PIF1, partial [Mycetomoellerius zeteki]|uniref:ATP-dependent DNA helicase PIF1 n=1 Tax=Mycetomoellerius zeteki TaxID=64791 RepID=UPI00084EAD67